VSEAAIKARITPPNLANAQEYVPLLGVPILDVHFRDAVDELGNPASRYCGPKDLENLCKNSQKLAERGDYAVVRVGHINPKLPNHEERKQPDIIGYIPKFYMGERDDQLVILADFYIKKKYFEDVEKYPRRSPEIFGTCEPDGYIDAVALLNRPPERSLGLVTYSKYEPAYFYSKEIEREKVMLDDGDWAKMGEIFKNALREVFELGEEAPAGDVGDEPEHMMMEEGEGAPASDESGPDLETMADASCGAMGGSGGGAGGTYPAATSTSIPSGVKEEKKKKNADLMQSNRDIEITELRGEFELFKKASIDAFKNARDRIVDLESNLAEKDAIIRRNIREKALVGLASRGTMLDVSEELELCSKKTDEEFDLYLRHIGKRYPKKITNLPFVPPAPSLEFPDRNPEMFSTERLTDFEKSQGIKLLEMYAKSHPGIERTQLQRTYLADIEYRKKIASTAVA
jgi:hypothetical protein